MCQKVKYIIVFFLGGIICTTIGVYATLTYNASQITYTKNNVEMPLSSALDELYTSANRDITFSNVTYAETLSTISATSKNQTISLTKGKWVVTFLRSSSWNRSGTTDQTGTSNYNLVCGDGNTVLKIASKSYQKSGTTLSNNSYITNRIYENMYFVDFVSNSGSCYVTFVDSTDTSYAPEIVTLQAVKINK